MIVFLKPAHFAWIPRREFFTGRWMWLQQVRPIRWHVFINDMDRARQNGLYGGVIPPCKQSLDFYVDPDRLVCLILSGQITHLGDSMIELNDAILPD